MKRARRERTRAKISWAAWICPTQRFGNSTRMPPGNNPCLHASIRSIIDRGMRVQRMQSRLACIDCCPACCHRHHSCSGPAIAFTDGRAVGRTALLVTLILVNIFRDNSLM